MSNLKRETPGRGRSIRIFSGVGYVNRHIDAVIGPRRCTDTAMSNEVDLQNRVMERRVLDPPGDWGAGRESRLDGAPGLGIAEPPRRVAAHESGSR
jgi:hypothetical protein